MLTSNSRNSGVGHEFASRIFVGLARNLPSMKSRLAYGQGTLELDLQGIDADIIEPQHRAGLSDEKEPSLLRFTTLSKHDR